MNITAAATSKIIGASSNHTFIGTGAGHVSYLFSKSTVSKQVTNGLDSYIDDFLHVIPSRLLIAEEALKTNESNQKKFTMLPIGAFESGREN